MWPRGPSPTEDGEVSSPASSRRGAGGGAGPIPACIKPEWALLNGKGETHRGTPDKGNFYSLITSFKIEVGGGMLL